MLSAWWGEDGFFAPYWDHFTGGDDFRELGPTKPWTPVTATDYFNCGFSESTLVAYRKKHSTMRSFCDELLGLERRQRLSSERVVFTRTSSERRRAILRVTAKRC